MLHVLSGTKIPLILKNLKHILMLKTAETLFTVKTA